MEITRKNYEAYFVDYLEGKLEEKLVDTFIEFLQKNPDLREELNLFEGIEVVPKSTSFSKKDKLYKVKYDEEKAFNKTAIDNLEGEISGKEKREFENYLSDHLDKQRDVELFSQTILKADENIHYEHKKKLYKKSGRTIVLFWAGRVAAVLILAFAIFSLMNTNDKTLAPENQVAQVEEKTENTEPANTVKTEETIPEAVENQLAETTPKEELLQAKTTNSIRNATNLSLEEKKLTQFRVPVENMPEMNSLIASIDIKEPQPVLATMTLIYEVNEPDEEHLLADNLKKKFSLKKITKAGLNLVTSISNERFTYETNDKGKVTEYNYESRLLAFSIPSSPSETE
ncbi:hypothetical protein [Maribellus mangrovi]|uniref:hypothetical protein n=1 Tax=Maribellus mangrovi TaxID=3133146 RepID=UPI0030ECFDB7